MYPLLTQLLIIMSTFPAHCITLEITYRFSLERTNRRSSVRMWQNASLLIIEEGLKAHWILEREKTLEDTFKNGEVRNRQDATAIIGNRSSFHNNGREFLSLRSFLFPKYYSVGWLFFYATRTIIKNYMYKIFVIFVYIKSFFKSNIRWVIITRIIQICKF